MELNHQSPLPLYQQFKELASRKIAGGEWHANEPIPPERILTETYGISRTTVRQAIADLVTEGRLYRVQGKGTFVAPRKVAQTLAELTGFAEELREQGLDPQIRVLAHNMVDPSPLVAGTLETNDRVLLISRVVLVDGKPLFTDESYVAPHLAPLLTAETVRSQPIYVALEAAGHMLSEGRQRLEASLPEPQTAILLGIDTSVPVIVITRTTYDGRGRPVEFTRAVFRSDRYHYEVHLRRSASIPLT